MSGMDIRAFREQYPAYDDMPDDVLADRLYQKHYSDLDRAEFMERFGVTARETPAAPGAVGATPGALPQGPVEPIREPEPVGTMADEGRRMARGEDDLFARADETVRTLTEDGSTEARQSATRIGESMRTVREVQAILASGVKPDGSPITAEERANYNAILSGEMRTVRSLVEATEGEPTVRGPVEAPEGTLDVTTDRARRAIRGATEVLASLPEFLSINAARSDATLRRQFEERLTTSAETIKQIVGILESGTAPDGATISDAERANYEGMLDGELRAVRSLTEQLQRGGEPAPASERPGFEIGEDIREASLERFGEPDPMRDREFWGKVAEAGGNMAGFISTALAAGLFGGPIAAGAATAGTGAALNSADIYREAIEHGADEETAQRAAGWGALIGTAELLPIMRMLEPVVKRFPAVGNRVGRILAAAAEGGIEEGIQEAGETIANNLIAAGLFDPERGWAEGVTESMIIGAIVGAGAGGGIEGGRQVGGAVRAGMREPSELPPAPTEGGGVPGSGNVGRAMMDEVGGADVAPTLKQPEPLSAPAGAPPEPIIDVDRIIAGEPDPEPARPPAGGPAGIPDTEVGASFAEPPEFSFEGYLERVVGHESGGDPTAENPRSSAGGLGQFIDSTWLSMVRRHAPEVARGKTEAQLLALKTSSDPEAVELQRRMLAAFTEENIGALERAGFEINDTTVYMAHFFGAAGAVRVLRADPSTPIAEVVDDGVMAANPHLRGMTAAQAIRWAGQAIGRGGDMVGGADRVQPDMLGGEEMTEDDVVARDEILEALRRADREGMSEFELVREYLEAGAAKGAPYLRELERRGAMPEGLVREGYDFDETYPLPTVEAMDDAFRDPAGGLLADSAEEAFGYVSGHFADLDRVVSFNTGRLEAALKAGDMDAAEAAFDALDHEARENLGEMFGEEAATAYREARELDLKGLRNQIDVAGARIARQQIEASPTAAAPKGAKAPKITGGTPKTKAMKRFVEKEAGRITGISYEDDGVLIYTDTTQWQDDAGAGTFRGDTEAGAIKRFYEGVRPAPEPGAAPEPDAAPGGEAETTDAAPGEGGGAAGPIQRDESGNDSTTGPTVQSPADLSALDRRLRGEGFKSIAEARKLLSDILGTPVEPGTEAAKAADEIIETRIVMLARDIIASHDSGLPTFRALVDLYRRQPRLGVRTSTSIENQAYSTPVPLAYLAAWRAGLDPRATVYEPTAGNGALLITASPRKTFANEIDAERAGALREMGFKSTRKDATAYLPPQTVDVVIANPPFGRVPGKQWAVDADYTTKEIDHAIALKALEAMADGGSAALIIAAPNKTIQDAEKRSDAYHVKAKREFFFWLHKNYNVVDHFTVSGDLYTKQGAAWPVDVILIDGRGKSERPLPAVNLPVIHETWQELEERFEDGQLQPSGGGAAIADAEPAGSRAPEAPVQGSERPSGRGDREPGAGSGAAGNTAGEGDGAVREPDDVGAPVDDGDARPRPARPAEDRQSGRDAERVESVEGPQTPYKPRSGGRSLETLTPTNIAHPINDALMRLEATHGAIDAYVADKLGMTRKEVEESLSAEQVDAVGLAIENVDRGRAFIIGDQTGIGKGRVVASMLRYAKRQGAVPVFVTEKPDLYIDMLGDMHDVGWEKMLGRKVKALPTNNGLTLKSEDGRFRVKTPGSGHDAALTVENAAKHDVVFTTYNQLQTVKGNSTRRRILLEALAPQAFFVFDESHNAGGGETADGADGEDGPDGPPNRAALARILASTARGVMFSSATYAKRPSVMDLYGRTDMGLAVSDLALLGDAMKNGGVPMQQIVAQMLTEAGQYVRREKDMAGIEYNQTEVKLDRTLYDGASRAMAAIHRFSEFASGAVKRMKKEIKKDGETVIGNNSTGIEGVESTNFTSVMHNLIEAVVLGMKAEPAAQLAVAALERGEKPVVTTSFTLGAALDLYIEETGAKTGDPVDLSFADLFRRYLNNTRNVRVQVPFQKGPAERIWLSDDDLGLEGTEAFDAAMEVIAETDFSALPASPIDHIRKRIVDAGYSVSEITGRDRILRYEGDQAYLDTRNANERGSTGKQRTKDAFNDGRIDAIILNQSGSTGISLHASEKFKDQRRRREIIVQPERNVDTHMQILGRVNRTGQVNKPAYDQLVGDIPAEIRPAAVLAKKMASLNAITTAARRSAMSGDEASDILNEVGDEVVIELLADEEGLNERLGKPWKPGSEETEDVARKVTGRIMLLPVDEQERVFGEIVTRYAARIEELDAMGKNPLEMRALKVSATVVARDVRVERSGDSPFQSGVTVETIEMDQENKAVSPAEFVEKLAERLGVEAPEGKTPFEAIEAIAIAAKGPVEAEMDGALKEADAYADAARDKAKDPKVAQNVEARVRDTMDTFRDIRRTLQPGRAVDLMLAEDSLARGIVMGFSRIGKTVNPTAPSGWQVEVMLTMGLTMKVPFSKIALSADDVRPKAIRALPAPLDTAIEMMDRFYSSPKRQRRQIVTGNLLAGYEYTDGKGSIVTVEMDDGTVKRGILLPKDFTEKAVRRGISDPEAILAAVDRGEIITSDGKSVAVAASKGLYRISVVSAKATGARFYLSRTARDIAGKDFVLVSGSMRVEVERAQAHGIIEDFMARGAKFFETDEIVETDDMDRLGSSPMPNHQPLYSTMRYLPARPVDGTVAVGTYRVKLPPEHRPQRRAAIRIQLQKIIGARLYQQKIKGNSTLGFYRRRNGELRVKNFDDVEVMAHEMAHWMDFHSANDGLWTRFRKGLFANDRVMRQLIRDEINALSYTSNPAKISKEGFAEFVRLWLTRRMDLDALAPNALAGFEDALRLAGPDFAHQMRKLQASMHRWFFQGAEARRRGKIGSDTTITEDIDAYLLKRPAERARQSAIDHIHAAKVVERTLTGKINEAATSPYKLFQLVNGAEGIHEAVVRYGTPKVEKDGSLSYRGKGLRDTLYPIMKRGRAHFDLAMEYFAARRADELMAQGRENLFTREEIDAGLALAEKHKHFEPVFEDWLRFNGEMLDFYRDMGLITADQRTAFAEANKSYVPFHRVVERLEQPSGTSSDRGIGQRLFGGQHNVREIGVNIVEGLATNIRLATLARARNTLFEHISKVDDGALFAVRLAPDSKKVKVEIDAQVKRIADIMADMGLTVSDKNGMIVSGNPDSDTITSADQIEAALKANPALLEYWLHGFKPKTSETYITGAVIGGKWEWFEVRDPLLVEMFTGMRGIQTNAALRAAYGARNFMTRTVTSMLQFLGPNAVRDTVSASVMSKNGFVPIYDTIIGMGHYLVGSKLYREFMLQGGGYGTRIQARTEETRARRTIDLPVSSAWGGVAKLLASYDHFASTFEYGSRIGDYRRGTRAGRGRLDAAWQGREIATDFGKRPGNILWTGFVRTVPFMNASIQGIDKVTREFAEINGKMTMVNLVKLDRLKTKFILKATPLVAMTVLLWAINDDDERWHALTPDERVRFWWIFYSPDKPPIKIPKPHDLGTVFATIPEIALDYLMGNTDMGGGDPRMARETLSFAAYYSLAFWDYPGILQPYIEDATNETFTGAPVVPHYMADLPPELQFRDRTPQLYKQMGEAFGISPLQAEHYARGYLRYVEHYISDAAEAQLWDREAWGERPFARGLIDYVTYQFRGRQVPYRTRWTQGYYDLRRRADGISAGIRQLTRGAIADPGRLEEFISSEDVQFLAGLSQMFGQIDRTMAGGEAYLASIKYDPSLTAEEKEERIEKWYADRNELYGEFYRATDGTLREIEGRLRQ